MKAKSEITKELYVIIREFFITFSIQYGIFKCLNWEIPIFLLFLISLIIVVTIIFANTYSIKRIIFLLTIILLIGILLLTMFYNINALLFIKDALVWNYEYSKRIDDFHISYFIITVCILSCVIMKAVLTLEKNITAKFISAVMLIIFMIICAMYNVQLNFLVIGIMLFWCLDTIVEMSQIRAGKSEKYSERCLVPFIAGAVLLSICIPSEEQPIRWIWIRETVNSITDNIKEITYAIEGTEDDKENEFNVNNVGLTENKTKFFGSISDAREKNMLSIAPGNSFRIGYLNWIVRNKYIGNGWDKDKIEQSKYNDEYMMDLYEKLYNLYRSDLKQFPNEYFAKKIKYEICFDEILTKSTFRLENCYSINTINGIGFDTFGDNVYFNKKVKEGYIYNVSALIMNMENDNMKRYLRSLDENQNYYEELKKEKVVLEGSAFQEAVKEMMIYEDRVQYIMSDSFRLRLAERSSKIKEEYLHIPSETPDRVRKLARRITENCTNQYDKADAICKYLKNNYTYEINLGELPKGKDAVDYFLFEKKSGYCTYFASSMAIMCRSVGIPVRYVEGATIDYKENENDWYYIKTGNSHAWTEIYLEGFGWIRMDSTPSSFTRNFSSKEDWGISDSKSSLEVTDSNSSQSISGLGSELQDKPDSDEASYSEALGNDYNIALWVKYIFIGMILSIIFAVSGIGLFILNQKMIYKKSDNRQKVFISMKKILVNLEKQGYELKHGETLKEFIIRLEKDEGFIDDEIIKLLEWFQTVRYSKRIITEEEVFFVEQFLVRK